MTGKYLFNVQDAFTDFGIIFKKDVFAQLLSLPGAWPEDARKMALPIYIKGNNEADFWLKYNGFRSFITSGDSFTLLSNELHRRYKVNYESLTSFTVLTKIKGSGQVYCKFTLNLNDDYPDVFTYTRSGNFIKAGTSKSYTFKRMYSSFTLADATALGLADSNFNTDGQKYANTQI